MYEQLVREALAPVVDFYRGVTWPSPKKGYFANLDEGNTVHLRVDYEVAYENDDEINSIEPTTAIENMVVADLSDLVENGDVDNPQDWLLKAFDGAKKRGKEPVSVYITSALLLAELKAAKKTIEYTMYIRIGVEWE